VAGLAASSPEAVPTPAAPPRPAADPLLAAAPPSQPEETTPRSEAAPPPAETMAPVAETLQAQAASANPAAPAAPSVTREAAPPSPDQPVDAEALDAGFRLLSRGPLTYPGRARRLSRGGEARVEVGVDPTGRVSGVTVLHETRGWGFGEAARAAYAQARFTPPTVNGRPVHVRWRKTLRFQP
jgi:TonB family protein